MTQYKDAVMDLQDLLRPSSIMLIKLCYLNRILIDKVTNIAENENYYDENNDAQAKHTTFY
jgi:hypothetical protein